MYDLTYENMLEVNGGDAKDAVCTFVGVCGGIAGAASGALTGYAVTGHFITGPIAVVGGVVGGVAGAIGGYAGAKSTAEDAWDALFE